MKKATPLARKNQLEEKQQQKAKIIKFPAVHKLNEPETSSQKPASVKITSHYLYYRDKKIPISQFEKEFW
jgi:hypothetical protein